MYSNIGSKIKRLAQVVAIIGIVVFVITGLVMMITMPRGRGVLPGILTMILGAVISWIGSFFTYGFGQLIENTDRMVGNVPSGKPAVNPIRPPQPQQSVPTPQGRPRPQPQQNAPTPQVRPQPQQTPQSEEPPQKYVPIVHNNTQDNTQGEPEVSPYRTGIDADTITSGDPEDII